MKSMLISRYRLRLRKQTSSLRRKEIRLSNIVWSDLRQRSHRFRDTIFRDDPLARVSREDHVLPARKESHGGWWKRKVTEPWYRAVYPAGGATIQWIKNEAAWSSEPCERGLIGILIVVPGERPVPECLHEVWRGCNTKAALQRETLSAEPPPFKRNETLQDPFYDPSNVFLIRDPWYSKSLSTTTLEYCFGHTRPSHLGSSVCAPSR